MDFIKKYTSHEEYEVNKTPNVSLCIEDNETKHLHYTKKKFDDEYLTFEALESGTFTLTIGSGVTTGDVVSVSYSLDNGETWTTTNNVDGQKVTITTPTVNAGDEVLWKGNTNRMANNYDANQNSASTFSSTANFNARGNVMSLLYGDEFKDKVSLSGKTYCFYSLFYNTGKLVNGKNISLPATTLEERCYDSMFQGCESLTTAPELPATTLTQICYQHMFYGCTNLTTAPELPATTLRQYCYSSMFYDCTSLTTAPELPATTLAQYCYYRMFWGCTSLTTAPILPAKTLADDCYNDMFEGCTSLTTAPVLPATTLVSGCYAYMFRGCTNLTTAPELPANTLAQYCYRYMFSNCTSLTTAPQLPVTTLAHTCYNGIFAGCTSLTVAPELPATTLTQDCYAYMFRGCTSLTTAPVLPATTLVSGCYSNMFNGCTNINSITCLATDISPYQCTINWVNGVAASGTFIKHPSMTGWTSGVNGIPEGWETTDFVPSENYLTFDITSSGTIVWKASTTATTVATISYSINGGEWTNITSSTAGTSFNVSDGDKVRFKGNNARYSTSTSNYNTFSGSTASFNLEGNIMSLIDDTIFDYKTTLDTGYTFNSLFRNTNVNNAENLILPATALASYCYGNMFYNCTSLTTAPELPATTLAYNCYQSMFANCTSLTTPPKLPAITLTYSCYCDMFGGCTSLTTAPELPATTLAIYCYQNMFIHCKSLTSAPELPATTLASNCYGYMFYGCTSLTVAPELPATTLTEHCYDSMFRGCTNLTTAPELPATTLRQYCYSSMFYDCTSLNSITCLATDISATDCTTNWVKDVASSGTFIKADGMNDWTIGSNGIPTNWTVEDFYATKYFTTVARENGTISFNIWKSMGTDMITSISYSTDNGETWTTTANTDNKTANLVIEVGVNEGDKVLWKGDATQLGFWDKNEGDIFGSSFSSDCEFDTQGNVMSLLYGDNFNGETTIENDYTFADLFSSYGGEKTCKVVNAKNLSLPATTLAGSCYQYMFSNCTTLTTAPVLPATELAYNCYDNMFFGCVSLTTAPALPATTLTNMCYNGMFYGCTSLTTAPSILPATTLAAICYQYMFYDCRNLTIAPALPATTLTDGCYQSMFKGCTNLNSITCLATDISANYCTQNWVDGVASSGTFTKATSMTGWTTGVNGIPTNWNVEDYSTISISLVMYVDDFPESKLQDGGETVEYVMNRQLNSSDECIIGNKYVYTGETIAYNGNTYYLWEMSDDCSWDSQVAYLLTTTVDFNTLYNQSLEGSLTNHFTSLVGRLDEDKDGMYNDGEIGSEHELYLVKLVNNNSVSLRIWVDDFPEDVNYGEGSAQNKMTAEVEDPEGEGANPYEYLGETIVYNGNTYYLWQAVDGYNIDNSMTRYFATTTIDFNALYGQSLEDDLTNHFTDAIGMFDDSKNMYWAQSIGDDGELYLVKVEDLS